MQVKLSNQGVIQKYLPKSAPLGEEGRGQKKELLYSFTTKYLKQLQGFRVDPKNLQNFNSADTLQRKMFLWT